MKIGVIVSLFCAALMCRALGMILAPFVQNNKIEEIRQPSTCAHGKSYTFHSSYNFNTLCEKDPLSTQTNHKKDLHFLVH